MVSRNAPIVGVALSAMALIMTAALREPPAAPAAAAQDAQAPRELVVTDATGGSVRAVAVADNVTWLGVGNRLFALDVTGETPSVLGSSLPLNHAIREVVTTGSFVYVATTLGHIHVFDGRGPGNPHEVAAVDLPTEYPGAQWLPAMATSSGTLFVARGDNVHVVDIRNPAAPAVSASYSTAPSSAAAIAVSGDSLFVGIATIPGDNERLDVVDVADIRAPQRDASLSIRSGYGRVTDLAVLGEQLLLATGANVHIIDVADRSRPHQTGTIPLEGSSTTRVAGHGTLAVVATAGPGLRDCRLTTVDMNNPIQPAIKVTRELDGTLLDMGMDAKGLYVADGAVGFRLIDPKNLTDKTTWRGMFVKNFDFDDQVGAAVRWGGQVGEDRLAVLDPSGELPDLGNKSAWAGGIGVVEDLAVDGLTAFTLSRDALLSVIDLSQADGPVVDARITELTRPYALAASDGALVVLDVIEGLVVFDARDTESVVRSATFPLTVGFDCAVDNGMAWIAADGALVAVDVSDPSAPSIAAHHSIGDYRTATSWFVRLAFDESMLIVAALDDLTYSLAVAAYDVSDPLAITRAGLIELESMEQLWDVGRGGIDLTNGWAMLNLREPWYATSAFGTAFGLLLMLDFTEPDAPRVAAMREVFDPMGSSALARGQAWYAAGPAGLLGLATGDPLPATQQPPSPTTTPEFTPGNPRSVYLPQIWRWLTPATPGPEISLSEVTGGGARSVALDGDLLYLGEGRRLSVVSASAGASNDYELLGTTETLSARLDHVVPISGAVLGVMDATWFEGDTAPSSRRPLSRLAVFDVRDPTKPTVHDVLILNAYVSARPLLVEFAGQPPLLFVPIALPVSAVGETLEGRVWVFDVADPMAPRRVAAIDVGAPPSFVVQHGEHLILALPIAYNESSLQVLDISDPLAPSIVAGAGDSISLAGAQSATVVGSTMTVVGPEVSRLFDISDPRHLTDLGVLERAWVDEMPPLTLYSPLGATRLEGGLALFWFGSNYCGDQIPICGLTLYDLRDPSAPAVWDWAETGHPLECLDRVSIANHAVVPGADIVWANGSSGGLKTVSLDEHMQIKSIGRWGKLGTTHAVAAVPGVVTAVGGSHLNILAQRDNEPLSVMSAIELRTMRGTDVRHVGPRLWLAGENLTLAAVDLGDPFAPRVLASVTDHDGEKGRRVTARGEWAYVADAETGLLTFDASDPVNIQQAALYDPGDGPYDIDWVTDAAGGKLLAVAAGAAGVQLLDVSRPPKARDMALLPVDGDVVRVTPSSSGKPWALVASVIPGLHVPEHVVKRVKLTIIGVSKPATPLVLGDVVLPTTGVEELAHGGAFAYVLGPDGVVLVVNVFDSSKPYLAEIVAAPVPVEDIAVVGSRVYGAMGYEGLWTWNVER